MRILKKVQHKYFEEVAEGRKPFEVRLADFKCKTGDILVLLEQKEGSRKLSGRKLECEIVYKLNTKKTLSFYSKKEIEKYGLLVLGVRRKFKYRK